MKKNLLLLSIVALAACDKPTSDAKLICNVDKFWQRSNVLYLNNNYHDMSGKDNVNVNVNITTYKNYAKLTTNNITTTFEKVREEKDTGEFGYVDITYKGNFPGSERTALLRIYGDITNKQILSYQLEFIGQKMKNDSEREFSVAHSCSPVEQEHKDKLWSSAIPFNHNYKMPNKIEKCITKIMELLYCENERCDKLSIDTHVKIKTLSQDEALSLSKNWNYSDMKLYQNDGKLEEHEKDACEVLDRINKFINDNNLDSHDFKTIQKAMDDCGDDCGRVLATGEKGDYLIQLPETDELRKISDKIKNTKFLSVFNPNSYTKQGYCLVNIVPFKTMEKLGTPDNHCHYRIYCGTPEYINYDEFYATEICQ